jgi:hypothetical protein
VSGWGRGGAAPRNKSEWIRFDAAGGHQVEEQEEGDKIRRRRAIITGKVKQRKQIRDEELRRRSVVCD